MPNLIKACLPDIPVKTVLFCRKIEEWSRGEGDRREVLGREGKGETVVRL